MMKSLHRYGFARAALAAAVAAGLGLTLSACGASSSGGPSASSDTLLVDSSLGATTLDPAVQFDNTAENLVHQMYDTLLTYHGDNIKDIVPGLATSYKASADGRTYTFTLRKDAKFADGTPLTSADVAFSYNRTLNMKSNNSHKLTGIKVSTPDANTVVLNSDEPNPQLPALVATDSLAIVNAKQVKAAGGTDQPGADKADKAGPWFNSHSAGSGPYQLQSFTPNSQVVLVANPNYWGKKPAFSKVIIKSVTSTQQQLQDVQNGGAQVAVNLSGNQVKQLSGSVTVHSVQSPTVVYMALSNDPGSPTSDADFRKAIALSIDYAGLVQLAGERAVQAAGVIPASIAGSLPPSDAVKRDLAAAKAALAASGKANETVQLSYGSDYAVDGLTMGTFAQRIQASVAEAGIKMKLVPAPNLDARTQYSQGKTQIALWNFPQDVMDPFGFTVYNPGDLLPTRIHWPASAPDARPVVELADKALAEMDSAKRASDYQAWGEALNATYHFIPLFTGVSHVAGAKGITGLNINGSFGVDYALLGKS
ncbi:ABC transporter substrate-binding protein [Jatrophihabitans cynanchi]|uniref:ABC transporter substrate-binding protein n=1 Tax=Jatrophihabitans cynanchi TaxID=2944128 RepID=A0ABY7K4T9_9ACTN|nr:ABC transporter substrate-binding protein [Jatrophihabitans sp. SB3-54]WAX58995.1 ABC transporter substrate-binding protein [Jatrophihabitans sp. SB3-54]